MRCMIRFSRVCISEYFRNHRHTYRKAKYYILFQMRLECVLLVVALASRKQKYVPHCTFFISFILHSLYSALSEVVLFAFFFPSRAKLIDRQRDYHSKNDAPCWNWVKKNMLNWYAIVEKRYKRSVLQSDTLVIRCTCRHVNHAQRV